GVQTCALPISISLNHQADLRDSASNVAGEAVGRAGCLVAAGRGSYSRATGPEHGRARSLPLGVMRPPIDVTLRGLARMTFPTLPWTAAEGFTAFRWLVDVLSAISTIAVAAWGYGTWKLYRIEARRAV